MRVLVTGNTGYIGTVLVPMLSDGGHDVVGLDSDLYEACTYGDDPAQIPTISKDIREVRASDLEGFDAILHLAGLSNDPLGDLNPALTFEINHEASVRLARLARSVGVERFIFSSSCSNYGAAGDELIGEEAEFNPVTAYGRSKVRVEQDVAKLADGSFSPTFLRNATAYGFSPRLRFDLVVNNLVAWAFTTGKVFLKSDGSPWRPLVHVEDISRAFIAALEAPRDLVHNQAFNIGRTDENYRIRDVAKIVRETVPGSSVELSAEAAPDKRNYRVRCDKVRAVLPDFEPKWTVSSGARQLYEAYKRIGLRLEEFEGPRYRRIDCIRNLIADGIVDTSLRRHQPELA